MDVACYALASAPGTLRLWVGARDATSAPAVDGWRVDGAPTAAVTAIRPMQSVRQGALLRGDPPRAFSGLYELAGIAGRGPFIVEATVGGQPVRASVRALPAALALDGEPLTVVLVSCYHHSTDGGLYGEALPRIARGINAPDLCVFMGDQVYLDLPTLMDFQDDPAWLGERFEQDYARNWFTGAFARGLGVAPAVFVPDDHEYWNNFPQPSPFIENTWTDTGRDHWREAARALYRGFQGEPGEPLVLDVEPLSFLLLDSRADRDAALTRLLGPDASQALGDWAARVAGDARFAAGVLVTGQSLLQDAVGGVKGSIGDYALADHEPAYRELLQALTRVSEAGKPVLLLTGDVHWGRVSSVRDRQRDAVVFHEVIASPSSLVATIGADQVKDVIGAVKDWFGSRDPWPRHGGAQAPPSHLPHSGQRFRTAAGWRGHRGNQVAVLRMTRRAAGIDVEYTLHPLVAGLAGDVPPTSGRLELRRTA